MASSPLNVNISRSATSKVSTKYNDSGSQLVFPYYSDINKVINNCYYLDSSSDNLYSVPKTIDNVDNKITYSHFKILDGPIEVCKRGYAPSFKKIFSCGFIDPNTSWFTDLRIYKDDNYLYIDKINRVLDSYSFSWSNLAKISCSSFVDGVTPSWLNFAIQGGGGAGGSFTYGVWDAQGGGGGGLVFGSFKVPSDSNQPIYIRIGRGGESKWEAEDNNQWIKPETSYSLYTDANSNILHFNNISNENYGVVSSVLSTSRLVRREGSITSPSGGCGIPSLIIDGSNTNKFIVASSGFMGRTNAPPSESAMGISFANSIDRAGSNIRAIQNIQGATGWKTYPGADAGDSVRTVDVYDLDSMFTDKSVRISAHYNGLANGNTAKNPATGGGGASPSGDGGDGAGDGAPTTSGDITAGSGSQGAGGGGARMNVALKAACGGNGGNGYIILFY